MRARRIILSGILSVFMVFTMMPAGFYSAFAEEGEAKASTVESAEETDATSNADNSQIEGTQNGEDEAESDAESLTDKSGG